jgi:hypothetical protein
MESNGTLRIEIVISRTAGYPHDRSPEGPISDSIAPYRDRTETLGRKRIRRYRVTGSEERGNPCYTFKIGWSGRLRFFGV